MSPCATGGVTTNVVPEPSNLAGLMVRCIDVPQAGQEPVNLPSVGVRGT
jgi:hypothetical protein